MAAGSPGPDPQRPAPRHVSGDAAYADARDNRGLTAGLAGTSIAILTFVLFFLYGPWKDGSINGLLFQATLVNIVVGLFLMSISSMNFWFVMEAIRSDHPNPGLYRRRAEGLWVASWILIVLEPTLILVTAGLYYAGAVALAFWVLTILLLLQGWNNARTPGSAPG